MTPAWIEPATFWFLTQHLNHCATAVPHFRDIISEILKFRGMDCIAVRNSPDVCDVLLSLDINSGFFPPKKYLFIQPQHSVHESDHARCSTVGYASVNTSHIIRTLQNIIIISSASVPVPIIRTNYSDRSYNVV